MGQGRGGKIKEIQMQRISVVVSVLILLFSHGVGFAGEGKAGHAGAFLQLSIPARAAGMGGAFVALADDASAFLSNPAGSFQIRRMTAAAAYRKMTLDRRLSWFGFLLPVRKEASIGLNWISVGVGELYERDDRGELGKEISDSENVLSFNFSRKMSGKILMGLNIKYIQHNLVDLSAYGVGFDFGILLLPIQKLKLGFAAQNVGMRYSWASGGYWKKFGELGTSTKDEFPLTLKSGASWAEFENKLIAGIELEKDAYQDPRYKIGAEYVHPFHEDTGGALRLGLDNGSLAFGLGLRRALNNLNFVVDYAYLSGKAGLEADHIVSMELSF
jgi:hypothetical protein